MSLTTSSSRRALKHTRAIHIEAFVRDDGLWELDARITDTKASDLPLLTGNLPAGEPLHDLWLRLTLDRQYTIVAVDVNSDAVPYRGYCDTIGPAYNILIGLSLVKGFRHALKERIGGVQGCTHLTELAQILPTVAIQAFSSEFGNGDVSGAKVEATKPPQLDHCHALRSEGAVVAKYYPKWAISPPVEVTPSQSQLFNQASSFKSVSEGKLA
ncbi:DUF2889 domain-containing protein [Paraherbaspirillum soli]|uniref:DUF2889 domain-containing protein n=1 Tax=Paraherbaspirillum soli TaxID=631222 RepID=A0ABW0MB33_9BURK